MNFLMGQPREKTLFKAKDTFFWKNQNFCSRAWGAKIRNTRRFQECTDQQQQTVCVASNGWRNDLWPHLGYILISMCCTNTLRLYWTAVWYTYLRKAEYTDVTPKILSQGAAACLIPRISRTSVLTCPSKRATPPKQWRCLILFHDLLAIYTFLKNKTFGNTIFKETHCKWPEPPRWCHHCHRDRSLWPPCSRGVPPATPAHPKNSKRSKAANLWRLKGRLGPDIGDAIVLKINRSDGLVLEEHLRQRLLNSGCFSCME